MMSAVGQVMKQSLLLTVVYSLLIAVNGQLTNGREEYREPLETRFSIFMQQMEALVSSLNDRFDTIQQNLDDVTRNVTSLTHEMARQVMTSQINHNDQLNKLEHVTTQIIRVRDVMGNVSSSLFNLINLKTSDHGCPLLNVVNADVTHLYLNYVNVTCHPGYHFGVNQSWIVTQCHDNDTWSPMPTECNIPRDCSDILALGFTTSGVYTVYVGDSQRPLAVYCDMTTESGGWTVFQRRQDGSVDFYRNWVDYQQGFGDVSGEFWIGNDILHTLTSQKRYKLRVDMTQFDGSTGYAEYDNFTVASAADKYRLSSIGTYSGTVGDSLSYNVRQQFTTMDQDNDQLPSDNCAVNYRGGWWYGRRLWVNLNGRYYTTYTANTRDTVNWLIWTNQIGYHSLKKTEMKIKQCD